MMLEQYGVGKATVIEPVIVGEEVINMINGSRSSRVTKTKNMTLGHPMKIRSLREVGFTLAELLVVLVIITIATLLLFPALQKVREAASTNLSKQSLAVCFARGSASELTLTQYEQSFDKATDGYLTLEVFYGTDRNPTDRIPLYKSYFNWFFWCAVSLASLWLIAFLLPVSWKTKLDNSLKSPDIKGSSKVVRFFRLIRNHPFYCLLQTAVTIFVTVIGICLLTCVISLVIGVKLLFTAPGFDKTNFTYGNDRHPNNEIQYGKCRVSIPKDHRIGHLESPSILRFEVDEDPNKHV